MSKVFQYYRISTPKSEHDRQECLVNDYAQQHGLTIDDGVYEKNGTNPLQGERIV